MIATKEMLEEARHNASRPGIVPPAVPSMSAAAEPARDVDAELLLKLRADLEAVASDNVRLSKALPSVMTRLRRTRI